MNYTIGAELMIDAEIEAMLEKLPSDNSPQLYVSTIVGQHRCVDADGNRWGLVGAKGNRHWRVWHGTTDYETSPHWEKV